MGDEETVPLGNDAFFSWAIMSLFAWLVPHISMEIREYHRALRKSPLWSTDVPTMRLGRSTVHRAAIGANLFSVVLVVAAACGVALSTKNLDSRMVSIVIGLSRLMAAATLFALSWKFPEWLEVYHTRQKRQLPPLTRSIRALRFNVFCSITWQYVQVYFFLLPFYCGAGPVTIPVSAAAGICIGFNIDICTYWGQKHVSDGDSKGARRLVYAMIFIAVVFSAALFANGCLYINDVWEAHEDDLTAWLASFFPWLLVGMLVHFALWNSTKSTLIEKMKHLDTDIKASSKYKNAIGKKITKMSPGEIGAVQAQDDYGTDHEVGEGTGDHKGLLEDKHLKTHSDPEMVQEPDYCSLVKSKLCGSNGEKSCFFRCCAEHETCTGKTISWCWWITWTVLSYFSLYFILINIGATYQQDVVRAKLPSVKVMLYKNMNDIAVCAYNGDGTEGSLNETSVIATFHNKEAANILGFLVLHCGPCGACSTWPNIKYEYTTRTFLAEESARCARKSLMGGEDAVHSCLMAPPINWDDACGRCWTTDVLCAKKHCAFNFLQSTMINTVGNFQVGMEHVTAASCEEANCEAFAYPTNFVECSGATRRRMNVTSMIARPKDEECANVDVSWERLFPGE